MLRHRKAQSTAEYVIVLGLIVAAVIAMQTYVKRGLQGRIRDTVDYVDKGGDGAQPVDFKTVQYEPYYLKSSFDSERSSTDTEELLDAGAVSRTTIESSKRSGTQEILKPETDADY